MIHNSVASKTEDDSRTYKVRANGVLLICEPVTELPLARGYFVF